MCSICVPAVNRINVTPLSPNKKDRLASVNPPPDYCLHLRVNSEIAPAQPCGAVPIDSADYANEPERIPKLSAVTLMTPELTLRKKFFTPAAITLKMGGRRRCLQ